MKTTELTATGLSAILDYEDTFDVPQLTDEAQAAFDAAEDAYYEAQAEKAWAEYQAKCEAEYEDYCREQAMLDSMQRGI